MVDHGKPLKRGDIVARKYRIEEQIGSGGMSVVYGATELRNGTRRAIKCLRPEISADTVAVKRFFREADACSRIAHPNIVEVVDLGSDDELFYLVMPWLDGQTLKARLARDGRLSLPRACALLLPCMEGVAAAHAVGVIHRDLKPENIFLCSAGGASNELPKVLDFGISKLAIGPGDLSHKLTKTGTIMGTPEYMPYEQIEGTADLDHRADVYAFGVILYQVLSGGLPFKDDNFVKLAIKVSDGKPAALDSLVRGLAPGVVEIVERAMARNATDRYQSLDAMRAALAPFARGALAHASDRPRTSAEPRFGGDTASFGNEIVIEADAKQRHTPLERRDSRTSTYAAIALVIAALALVVWQRTQPAGLGAAHYVAGLTEAATPAVATAPVAHAANPSAGAVPAPTLPTDDPHPVTERVAPDVPAPSPVWQPPARPAPIEPLVPSIARPTRMATRQAPRPVTEPQAPEPSIDRDEQTAPAKSSGEQSESKTLPKNESAQVPPALGARASGEPADVAALMQEGASAFLRGQTPLAHDRYRKATERAPNNADAWRGLGVVSSRLGFREEARRAFTRYLTLRPDAPDAAAVRNKLESL